MNSLDNDRLIYFFLREIFRPKCLGVIKLSVFPGAKKKQKNNKKKKLKSNTEDPLNSSFVSYWWRKNKSQYSFRRITELKTRWEIWKSETVISLRSFGCDFLSPHGRRITVDSTYKHPIIIFHRFFSVIKSISQVECDTSASVSSENWEWLCGWLHIWWGLSGTNWYGSRRFLNVNIQDGGFSRKLTLWFTKYTEYFSTEIKGNERF